MVGKVAIVGVVGNEDGPHQVVADLFQALNDIGYTYPGAGFDVLETARRCRARTTTTSTRCPNRWHCDRRSGAQRSPSDGRVQRRAIPPYE